MSCPTGGCKSAGGTIKPAGGNTCGTRLQADLVFGLFLFCLSFLFSFLACLGH
jgi:hypothetical protein